MEENTHPQSSLLGLRAGFHRALVGQQTKTASSEPVTAASRGVEEGRQTTTGSAEQSAI